MNLAIEVLSSIYLIGPVVVGSLAYLFIKNNKTKSKTTANKITEPSINTETEKKVDSKLGIAQVKPKSPWAAVMQKTRDKWFQFSSTEKNALKEKLEEALLGADVGYHSTQALLAKLDFTKEWSTLREDLSKEISLSFDNAFAGIEEKNWPQKKETPHVILFIGVNGVGKTTSIAKIAKELKEKNHSVILAAGDTFRAAASDQLKQWGDRLGIPVIEGSAGADSSSVLFDAVKSGLAKKIDYILCDSAGRLHNNDQLMENLSKNIRVLEKALPGAPHDTILVLDANTGQNMIAQAKKFTQLGVTGLILSKLDGSAKGGAVIPLLSELKIPIIKIGVGESQDDMLNFDSKMFSSALLGSE